MLIAPWYSGLVTMAAWVGVTPPVTRRKGGRGSSSNDVRLIVVATVFVFGSITDNVLESSLHNMTRSRLFGPEAVCASARPTGNAEAIANTVALLMNSRRVQSMIFSFLSPLICLSLFLAPARSIFSVLHV